MTTYGDYFTGFGGMTIGAKAAGLDVLFGVEYDAQLADVYRRNLGDHVTVADVTQIDPASLPAVDVFHASPPCTNASVANATAGESPFDLAMATATVRYLETHKPRIFTLENVYQYRNFESWHYIARALLDLGYAYNFWSVNMADYGVPQTRKRMIVIARRDGVLPQLPEKTHGRQERRGLFGNVARWVSWYEAIEDLIPDLPDSEFAPWQLARLPEELQTGMMMSGNSNFNDTRAGKGWLEIQDPAATYTSGLTGGFPRALLVNTNMSGDTGDGMRTLETEAPAFTVTQSANGRQRAFIVPGGNASSFAIREQNEPARVIGDAERVGNIAKARVDGRIVKMTPRALARFQSFPDWYELPDSAALAAKGIGNAVPPLFAEKLYREVQSP
jgi:DNA (cytosine-5)-methyltransferase 1